MFQRGKHLVEALSAAKVFKERGLVSFASDSFSVSASPSCVGSPHSVVVC